MPTAYFSRVLNNTTWDNLLVVSQIQQARNCKPMFYNTLAEISINSSDFDRLGESLTNPNQCYLRYTSQSIADRDGIWNCIVVKSRTDNRKIVLYTAGRTYPLYAAPNI